MHTYKYLILTLLPVLAHAQTQWTNATGNFTLSTPGNWTNGVPASGGTINLGTPDPLGFDLGTSYTIGTINVLTGISASLQGFGGGDTLALSNSLNLASGSSIDIVLPFSTTNGLNSTWSIGSSSVTFSGAVEILAGTVSASIGNGGSLRFTNSNSPAWTGTLAITGTGSISITAIEFNSANLDNVTINGLPVQLQGETLSAIPEPATLAALTGGAILLGTLTRRRRQA
jgi:hypothetical protein